MNSVSGPGNPLNLLGKETSPYLLQHKDNPVAWRPWGDQALSEARALGRPILLSVGYAACHWCHVMAHESFENSEIAGLMNALFVNIKVDREERPDLDQIYQQALAILGEHGGWPLTMFLKPDGSPFWGGTYFPPESRWGRPGFPEVLRTIAGIYANETEKVEKNVAGLKEAMARLARPREGGEITDEAMNQIAARLLGEVDSRHGGIGTAPKFPQVPIFQLFWRAWKRTREVGHRDAVLTTLACMAQGGIYDHLGGGFARYATDRAWLVPHFEKMLYDNAELVSLMTLAWQETRDPLFEARVRETIGWLAREMLAAPDKVGDRAFAASLDADSEGEEGRFYVWSVAEIDQILGGESDFFKRHYDVREGGNWEGHSILNRSSRPELLDDAGEKRLADARAKLLERRASRQRPGWDDKVLADWNGSMIVGLAQAAQVFEEPAWLALGRAAFRFLRANLMVEGRLFHSWRDGRHRHAATLDDHANMAAAALALREATGEDEYLANAREFVELLDWHFWDREAGGYFMTADDVTDLVLRPKSASDGATPNGNGTMVEVLARLQLLTGEEEYAGRVEALVMAFSGELERNIFPFATFLNSCDFLRHAIEIVIVGEAGSPLVAEFLKAAHASSSPNRILSIIAPGRDLPATHPAHGKGMIGGRPAAYVCRGRVCGLPIAHPAGLSVALRLA